MELAIGKRWAWDGDTKIKAQVIFVMREKTIRLQKRDMNIRKAYSSVSDVKSDLVAILGNVDARFDLWYLDILELAKVFVTNEQAPREKRSKIHIVTYPTASSKTS